MRADTTNQEGEICQFWCLCDSLIVRFLCIGDVRFGYHLTCQLKDLDRSPNFGDFPSIDFEDFDGSPNIGGFLSIDFEILE